MDLAVLALCAVTAIRANTIHFMLCLPFFSVIVDIEHGGQIVDMQEWVMNQWYPSRCLNNIIRTLLMQDIHSKSEYSAALAVSD